MVQTFKDEAATGKSGHAMHEFHCFLHLNAGDDGGNRRCRGHFAFGDFFVREQIAGHPAVQDGPVDFTERALVTRGSARKKNAGNAVYAFDGSINPGAIDFPGGAIEPEAGFAIVEAGKHYVAPIEQAKTAIAENVCDDGLNDCIRRNGRAGAGGDTYFEFANVFGAVKNRARKIRHIDAVGIDDYDTAESEQNKILENFIAQGAGANHENLAGRQLRLVPPRDQPQSAEPVFVQVAILNGEHGQGAAHPAVISGWRRRMSPSCTCASAKVCVSCTWRPEFL